MVGIKLYWKYIGRALISQDDISVADHTGAPLIISNTHYEVLRVWILCKVIRWVIRTKDSLYFGVTQDIEIPIWRWCVAVPYFLRVSEVETGQKWLLKLRMGRSIWGREGGLSFMPCSFHPPAFWDHSYSFLLLLHITEGSRWSYLLFLWVSWNHHHPDCIHVSMWTRPYLRLWSWPRKEEV